MTIAPETPTGHPVCRTVPTTFAQRRMWFLDRLEPGGTAYNVPVAARLVGDLDVTALTQALTALFARQEALRVRLTEDDGEPMQVIDEAGPVPLPVRDIDGDELEEAIRVEAAKPFDLMTGPLLRATLLREAADRHVLVVVAHHVIVDAWSLGLFFHELNSLYGERTSGVRSELPEITVTYGDFAVWQRKHGSASALVEEVEFWRTTLAGAPTRTNLATESPRPQRPSGTGTIVSTRFSAELTDDLAELSGVAGVTPYMTLLAAFQVLVGRYTRSNDVVVGTAIAGRGRLELEPVIGCFINTLPQRTDLSGSPTFRELLGRVRTATLNAFDHQNLSFEHIVEAVRPERSIAETPIFQVMFTLNNTPPVEHSGGPLRFEFLPLRRDAVKYDLNVTVSRVGEELEIAMEYRTDLFGPDWGDRFVGHYRTLLTAAALDPDQSIWRLPLLTEAERGQLARWNETAVEFPSNMTVHELISQQVEATPDAPAVVFENVRLSYRELQDRVEVVARRLAAAGVGPGSRVGLCMYRSVELVVGLLAALQAGAAYVPLEPKYPRQRLGFMLDDAHVDVVLTHRAAKEAVPASARVVIDLDHSNFDLGPGIVQHRAACIAAHPSATGAMTKPHDPAYVIYTSGSTGRPKGVVNTHRGLVNRLVWMQRLFRLDVGDAVLQKTPFSFDVSAWEFLWPLLAGARLVLARPEGHKDPTYLAGLIQSEQVTTVHFVPSMLRLFLETADVAVCSSLRQVLCSGEALSAETVRQYHRSGANASLHNLYGPTEAAIDVAHWECLPDGPTTATGGVPIGRPIANTSLYVLDEIGGEVPIGVPGELAIGGVQVAVGYLNRPELTAEVFVPNPFGAYPFETMYRTGDLARWRTDGTVEYLGRLDDQVKLRGFRIELGEIESVIRQQEEIRDVVVIVRDERLVAYVVGDAERLSNGRLRELLASRLPEYMVPALVVWLTAMPLSANGKVDRVALPAPDVVELGGGTMVQARDSLELELVALWEELLEVSPISVTDDFFVLGGSSLQVIRMLSRVTRRWGRELPVSSMFTSGATIERIARQLRSAPDARSWSPMVPLHAAGSRLPVFFFPPAVGTVLCYLDLVRQLPADQPVYGLQAAGLDAGQEPFANLEEFVEVYVREIREVQPQGPYQLVGYCVGSVAAMAVAQRLRSEGASIGALVVIDGGPPSMDNGFEEADEADIAAWFGWELGRASGHPLVIDPDELRGLTGTDLARDVLARAVAAHVVPPDTAPGQLSRLLATFCAGVKAVRGQLLAPYPGPVVAFRASDEPPESSPLRRLEPLAAGGMTVRDMPGDHYTMLRPPNVALLAEALVGVLSGGNDR